MFNNLLYFLFFLFPINVLMLPMTSTRAAVAPAGSLTILSPSPR